MKKLLFFLPLFAFLASCVKDEEAPKPTKAYVTDIKVENFPTTDGGKAWDANALSTSATAPDMYFEISSTATPPVVLLTRNTIKQVDNVTTTNLPTWTLAPKFELASFKDAVNINFYDQDSAVLDNVDDFMGSCKLDMSKETRDGAVFPKTITIDNGTGLKITVNIEYAY
jgi:hypothetical protein